MTFQTLDTVNATEDLSELFIYANNITNGIAMPLVLFGFFVIVFLGGAFAQMRFKGSVRIDFAFTVAGFVTFGLAVLMSLKSGLLSPIYLFMSLGVSIVGVIWIYLSQDN